MTDRFLAATAVRAERGLEAVRATANRGLRRMNVSHPPT